MSPTPWTLDIHLTQPDRWLPLLLGQVPAMILPREWETLSNFASHPIGTGPYAVIRNSTNQLKIQAFDDFFGYRALIDEVNVWVLPEIADEPAGGLMLKGPQGEEKEIESRLEEGLLLFTVRQPHPSRGESASQGLGKLCAFSN
ncbi:putative substrate-binding protein [Escherichia coli]|nr:putative substrate-binding protein [Escherichia coli]